MKPRGWPLLVVVAVSALVAACGGGSSTASPSPSPTAAHVAQSGEPALVEVAGYGYVDPADPSMKESVASTMTQVNATMPGLYTAGSIHGVTKDGADLNLLVMALQLGPTFADLMGENVATASGALTGMAPPGTAVTTTTISSQPTATATFELDGDPVTAYSWVHGGVVTVAFGEKADEVTAYATRYLEGLHE